MRYSQNDYQHSEMQIGLSSFLQMQAFLFLIIEKTFDEFMIYIFLSEQDFSVHKQVLSTLVM